AHAVAYVILSLRVAWFKVYYPVEYYSATFTLKVDDFDATNMCHGADKASSIYLTLKNAENNLSQKEEDQKTVYELVLEMYARGIDFLPIDLYKSDATRFLPEGNAIRPPLCSLSGLGQSAGESIVRARDEGEFLSVEDLKIRSGVNKNVIEVLRQEGCLDNLPETNQLSLFDFSCM
ncbi:MAG TPA: PolC-type DNA polymerase III, partial [Clostridia bacterium]|nr:PolC-type DNA polymerase III [Clostridia bacterium]